ncbi:ELL factor, partial [Oxylabes madagascariensis]|nr:ELL factor [Oxylabes madagascariensis]
RKYAAISSSEQRQSYKNDFNAEYNEYRDLHARIERITRRFTQLDAKLKQLLQGSEEYKVETGLKTPEKKLAVHVAELQVF